MSTKRQLKDIQLSLQIDLMLKQLYTHKHWQTKPELFKERRLEMPNIKQNKLRF